MQMMDNGGTGVRVQKLDKGDEISSIAIIPKEFIDQEPDQEDAIDAPDAAAVTTETPDAAAVTTAD